MQTFNKVVYWTTRISIACILMNCQLQAQESGSGMPATKTNSELQGPQIHPLRFGVEFGAPSVLNLNVEYVTPLLNNRVAFYMDYLPFKFGIDDITFKMNNFEIGSNIYFGAQGKGLYASVGYFRYKGEAQVPDVDFDDGSFGGGETSISFSATNLKIGAKFGDRFYFRIEGGFGFGSIPDELLITANDGSATTTEPIEDIVSLFGSAGIPLFSLGIGYSFL